jgi:hypothetical protein
MGVLGSDALAEIIYLLASKNVWQMPAPNFQKES